MQHLRQPQRLRARTLTDVHEEVAAPAVAADLAALASLVSTTTMEAVMGLAVLVSLGCGGDQEGEHTYDR